MRSLWTTIIAGYLRIVEPFIGLLVRSGVSPNTLTTIGTLCTCAAGVAFATGRIMTGGWILSVTAVFDLADGAVARRTNRSTPFGAFYDSTLDRVADGALFGGLTFFFASDPWHRSMSMVAVGLMGLVATFVISYTRARAEVMGIEMKGVGMIERPERITLFAAPQALFGLAFDGMLLRLVLSVLAATAIVTAMQRIAYVRWVTQGAAPVEAPPAAAEPPSDPPSV
ncbi:MAG: CDP-alcohol phosphatidyltransferase family protein [Gemmatimonadota bacterium]|nr:CDP-alcohol phosphatidyltransferase family protein [Gemmatimonadota bacterium]